MVRGSRLLMLGTTPHTACIVWVYCLTISESITLTTTKNKSRFMYATERRMCNFWWIIPKHHGATREISTLHWRHDDNDGVSNHQPHGCLLNRLKKTSKLRVTGLCVGNSPGPVNSPHKGPVTRKMFPFDDVIMKYKSRTWNCVGCEVVMLMGGQLDTQTDRWTEG